jgi:hypothetical protein
MMAWMGSGLAMDDTALVIVTGKSTVAIDMLSVNGPTYLGHRGLLCP